MSGNLNLGSPTNSASHCKNKKGNRGTLLQMQMKALAETVKIDIFLLNTKKSCSSQPTEVMCLAAQTWMNLCQCYYRGICSHCNYDGFTVVCKGHCQRHIKRQSLPLKLTIKKYKTQEQEWGNYNTQTNDQDGFTSSVVRFDF